MMKQNYIFATIYICMCPYKWYLLLGSKWYSDTKELAYLKKWLLMPPNDKTSLLRIDYYGVTHGRITSVCAIF